MDAVGEFDLGLFVRTMLSQTICQIAEFLLVAILFGVCMLIIAPASCYSSVRFDFSRLHNSEQYDFANSIRYYPNPVLDESRTSVQIQGLPLPKFALDRSSFWL